MSQFLITIDAAMRALASANTPQDLIDLADKAEAFRSYARRAKLGMDAQNRCAELRLRAERKLGGFLVDTPRHPGGRPKPVPQGNGFSTLSDLGVTRKLSHRAQRLAAISQREFEAWLRGAYQHELEITTRDLLNMCERREAPAKNQKRIVGGRVKDLVEFARRNKMGTIVIDPPWHIPGSSVLPYLTVTLDELQRLPIPDLAAHDRCHLHVWTLPNDYMFSVKPVIEAWGFRIVSSFVWVKPALGRGNYWRMSHEVLLTAVRGDADRFDDHSLRSWAESGRRGHSEKPEIVREMIERASPGPRLEIFARKLTRGWYAWGHDIAEPLSGQNQTSGSRSRSPSAVTRINESKPDVVAD
jgi:N6-adenosine-specific RNA methylase IME4